jgi:hypothetical protein
MVKLVPTTATTQSTLLLLPAVLVSLAVTAHPVADDQLRCVYLHIYTYEYLYMFVYIHTQAHVCVCMLCATNDVL